MNTSCLAGFIVLGAIFGILGGIAAFLNSYEGYSHFPAISKRKKIIMSIEFALIAFIMVIIIVMVIFFLLSKDVIT
jgi:hypothetical protein